MRRAGLVHVLRERLLGEGGVRAADEDGVQGVVARHGLAEARKALHQAGEVRVRHAGAARVERDVAGPARWVGPDGRGARVRQRHRGGVRARSGWAPLYGIYFLKTACQCALTPS